MKMEISLKPKNNKIYNGINSVDIYDVSEFGDIKQFIIKTTSSLSISNKELFLSPIPGQTIQLELYRKLILMSRALEEVASDLKNNNIEVEYD